MQEEYGIWVFSRGIICVSALLQLPRLLCDEEITFKGEASLSPVCVGAEKFHASKGPRRKVAFGVA